jgi:hypothetical protein
LPNVSEIEQYPWDCLSDLKRLTAAPKKVAQKSSQAAEIAGARKLVRGLEA